MTLVHIDQLDFEKGGGLMPVVVQDHGTREILTLAYVNLEALCRTLSTGFAHFYRRSHRRVMMKGETSGHYQRIQEVLVDCDLDALVYLVVPDGPACHKGEISCFHYTLVPAPPKYLSGSDSEEEPCPRKNGT